MSKTKCINCQEARGYIKEVEKLLESKRVIKAREGMAGWHNFFTEGRIGTTGTAYPFLFYKELSSAIPYEDELLQALANAQMNEGSNRGGWAILSASEAASVEGTAWPLMALMKSSKNSRFAAEITDGIEWIRKNQDSSGGWGSNNLNSPRSLLTAIAVKSLCTYYPYPLDSIQRAIRWLISTQRKDGSWGPTPTDDGTVVHTALVLDALMIAGLGEDNKHVKDGIDFIKTKWQPNPEAFYTEQYEMKYDGDKYIRIVLQHDIDAAVVGLLSRSPGLDEMCLIHKAVSGWLAQYRYSRKVYPSQERLSIWNVVPKGMVLLGLARSGVLPRDGFVLNAGNSSALYPSIFHGVRSVASLVMSLLMLPKIFVTIVLLCTVSPVIMFYNNSITLKELVLSFVVPVGLTIVGGMNIFRGGRRG